MRVLSLSVIACMVFAALPVQTEAAESTALQAQLASALASADYAAKNCPNLQIDRQKIQSLVTRSGMTEKQLRALEDYSDQRDVIRSLESNSTALICFGLSKAHGGYARGIITER